MLIGGIPERLGAMAGRCSRVRRKELSLLMIGLSKLEARLTSNGSGPDQGVASPVPSVGFQLLHLLNLNHVARSAARGVRRPWKG